MIHKEAHAGRGEAARQKREGGIALALVLILIVLMITAVYTFSRRAVINVTIAQNLSRATEADALARGGLRLAEVMVYLIRLKEQGENAAAGQSLDPATAAAALAAGGLNAGGEDPWTQISGIPLEFQNGSTLTLTIEEMGAKLNLNALVLPETDDNGNLVAGPASEEALEYLVLVMRHIIDGLENLPEDRNYDERAIAENLLDYMDGDDSAFSGRGEDTYYQRQDPPYRARNGPFLSFEEIGLVEGIDPLLLRTLRDYVTIHPIGGSAGIDLNRAPPWVLPLVYSGPSGERVLLSEPRIRRLLKLRQENQLICTDSSADPGRCITLSEAGLDEGSIYPEAVLPAPVSVFRVIAEARVGNLSRRMEAIYDTRPTDGPQMLSFRRLRGS